MADAHTALAAGGNSTPGRVDGRTARAERTRRAIVEAHYALISEGDLKPTGERIAERAGVSLRALWTNFKDLETLFAATDALLVSRQESAWTEISPTLPFTTRVDEFCRQRARLLEIVAPLARAATIKQPFSAQLQDNRKRHIARVRTELEALFAHELAAAGPGRTQLLDALSISTTWAGWSLLRDELGLSTDEARATMSRTVTALLVTAMAAPVHSRG
ncbi:TetR/AcrR family transcriptional regulator [Catenuloplanes indicus]|uniref:AcrR family transcriptional regulator n=1 Tax=Catenuloplanes indicus TaxID=137267 RepID=A0AAE3W5Z7_9ACTN|nr:TetR/AcrR family transcriptional regulator [Catenuloplanes indicus]MDQ0370523.1 AcrR family transcriptional regulator [Catenuloplanes indicus]